MEITGYRELTDTEINDINHIKSMAAAVGHLIESMNDAEAFDQRWVAIAKTDLQKGFMALVRAVSQPNSF